jgi:hypothetical protein
VPDPKAPASNIITKGITMLLHHALATVILAAAAAFGGLAAAGPAGGAPDQAPQHAPTAAIGTAGSSRFLAGPEICMHGCA